MMFADFQSEFDLFSAGGPDVNRTIVVNSQSVAGISQMPILVSFFQRVSQVLWVHKAKR